MAGTQIAKYLSFSATQGSADAFVQATITTNLDPTLGLGYKIKKILFNKNPLPAVDGADHTVSLTRDTKTSPPSYVDPDTMFFLQQYVELATSGAFLQQSSFDIDFIDGIFVVEPTIYLQFDTTSTSAANAIHGRLYYEEVKLTEVEILRLLNNA